MSSMQGFFNQLSTVSDPSDSYWFSLARLTRLSVEQAAAFSSEIVWSIWD